MNDREDIARMMRKLPVTVPLPVECNASLQLALIRVLEENERWEQNRGVTLTISEQAFRIHKALVEELKSNL